MNTPRLSLSPAIRNSVETSYSLLSEETRRHVHQSVMDILEEKVLRQEIETLLTPDAQGHVDMRSMLHRRFSSASESIAFAAVAEEIIEQRWRAGKYILQCKLPLDLSPFDTVPVVDYEFMPTKVLPSIYAHPIQAQEGETDAGETLGTVGKLLIKFPKGAMEAEVPHTHPGGRIIVSLGAGRFNSKHVPNGVIPLEEGTVILMPRETSHNFAAYPDHDWTALSFHLPYAGTKERAIRFEDEGETTKG